MEQVEDVAETRFRCGCTRRIVLAAVFLVQRADLFLRQPQQVRVLRQRLLVCVEKIRQQGEVQVYVLVGQETDFQRFDEAVDASRAGKHRRDHHQRARSRRNAQ